MKLAALLALLLIPSTLFAKFPSPKGFVTDDAGVMKNETVSELNSLLSYFEKESGIEIAVATVRSLDGIPVEDYATDLFRTWGIGKKGKDDGLLFLIAPNDKKVRIEVGYGLEGSINDALAGRIMDQYVLPAFKVGDIDGGITAGTAVIVQTIAKKENIHFDPQNAERLVVMSESSATGENSGPLATIGKIFLLVLMMTIFIRYPHLFLFFLSSSGHRGTGRGFGGGFGGFGGGISGGGGASRGW
ncbi:MAG: hypothetical protein BWY40_00506 [bacterium ADurb.Bin270]|nr:MAG: hypothetical protein BWY40_00506 [bacterium ADurb.Bin270]HQG13346.1 TPM domain-containing protein [bacterium]